MLIPKPDLTRKALMALEEALNECDDCAVPKSMKLRFALAYLYSVSNGDRTWFDGFWQAVTDTRVGHSPTIDSEFRSSQALSNLNGIYRAVGVKRTNAMQFYELYAGLGCASRSRPRRRQ